MKKQIIPLTIGLVAMTLLSGCVFALNFGGGKKDSTTTSSTSSDSHSNSNSTSNASDSQHPTVMQQTVSPTIGQQLIDLKKARDAGAITEAEYEAEKAKLLQQK
jgi:hypothetical protein